MPNEIQTQLGTSTQFTYSTGLDGLANGSAYQTSFVNNEDLYHRMYIGVEIKNGTSPTGSSTVEVYLLRKEEEPENVADDGAADTNGAITIVNAPLIGVLTNKSSPSTGDVLQRVFVVDNPGPHFAIAIKNETGVALDNAGSTHHLYYRGENPEVQ